MSGSAWSGWGCGPRPSASPSEAQSYYDGYRCYLLYLRSGALEYVKQIEETLTLLDLQLATPVAGADRVETDGQPESGSNRTAVSMQAAEDLQTPSRTWAIWKDLSDDSILVSTFDGRRFTLHSLCKEVFEACNAKTTIREITDRLSARHPELSETELGAEVMRCLRSLQSKALIITSWDAF